MSKLSEKTMSNQLAVPEIDFTIGFMGITIYCDRLDNPRFLPFDITGKCKNCHSNLADIDFLITKEGIIVWCSRMKGERFVPFDFIFDLPAKCFFRVKSKGRLFTVPYVNKDEKENATNLSNNSSVEEEIKTTPNVDIIGKITMDTENVKNMEIIAMNNNGN